MFSFIRKTGVITYGILLLSTGVYADADHSGTGFNLTGNSSGYIRADSHAPIGVMGEHMHKQGEWMLSYRYMHMAMKGNRDRTRELTPEQIIASTSNRFFGLPNQPPNLRIVPTKMTMDMHMFGAMYAPVDWLTLMAMGMYVEKSMDHVTFNGPGTTRIGTFTTKSKGMADTKISGLIKLHKDGMHNLHLNAGVSIPTGSIKNGKCLNTIGWGTIVNIRLPYPMQLGSGTVDLLPGLTYSGKLNQLGWGAQYMGTFRTGDNEGYRLGDKQEITGWLSYLWQPSISTSVRISYSYEDQIKGIDPNIAGPVQTANPENIGGENIFLHLGLNLVSQTGMTRGHRLAVEAGIPLHRDLNGPQLETDLTVTAGWQYAF